MLLHSCQLYVCIYMSCFFMLYYKYNNDHVASDLHWSIWPRKVSKMKIETSLNYLQMRGYKRVKDRDWPIGVFSQLTGAISS